MVFVHSVALSNAAQNEARCWRREDNPVANTVGSANKMMAKIMVSSVIE
jgi:hypothetical protein